MAEINPPLYLDQDDAYDAAELGLPYRDIMGEGIVEAGDLKVTAGTGLKSSVAPGACWVKGDDDANAQPTYRCRNDAPVLLQHDAADATNDRIDLVIAQVFDSAFSGVSKLWRLAIVKGAPAATPTAPAVPTDAIPLAEVTIPAGSGTLGTITDRRARALVGGGAAEARVGATFIKTVRIAAAASRVANTFGAIDAAMAITVTCDGSRDVLLTFVINGKIGADPDNRVSIFKDGVEVTGNANGLGPASGGSSTSGSSLTLSWLDPAPSVGDHTYTVVGKTDGANPIGYLAGTLGVLRADLIPAATVL